MPLQRFTLPKEMEPPLPPPRPRKPGYARAIVSNQEFLFLPPRGLIRVPGDFEAFRNSDYFWGFLDQGYKSHRYRNWTLWKLVNRDWYGTYITWSLCIDPPQYCVTLLQHDSGDGRPGDGYVALQDNDPFPDNPMDCSTLWIADRPSLRLFFEAFPLNLFPKDPQEIDNYAVVENLLDLCARHSHDPSPLDYLYRFWPDVSHKDRQQFLREMQTRDQTEA
jgi:hypothetical protein